MTTYTWTVTRMLTLDTPKPGFVVHVFWELTASENGVIVTLPGSNSFTQPGDPFTPYDALTQAQVIEWVQAQLGPQQIANIKIALASNLQSKINPEPTPQPQPLPWA